MRVLIATTHRKLVGGIEKYLQILAPEMRDRGHELSLACEIPADPGSETIESAARFRTAWCLKQLGLEATLQSIADWKPDVVYSQGCQTARFEEALLDRYPTALFAHNYYGVCPTGQKCHCFPAPRPCQRRAGAMCLAVHYPRRCGGLNPLTMWRMYRGNAQWADRLPKYEAILVASRHMLHEYERQGVNPDRLQLLPLPNSEPASQWNTARSDSPRNRLLFIGRLTRLKGALYMVQAIPRAAAALGRPLSLVIAGDGPERPHLESAAQRLGLPVVFAGWVGSERRQQLILDADLLVVPSLWPEPFGLVGGEAGGLGLPAAGYAVGGIPEWLIPGHSGELAPGDPPTAAGLADAIVRALADPVHYTNLCRGAWEVSGKSTVLTHVAELETILDRAARRGAISPSLAAHGSV